MTRILSRIAKIRSEESRLESLTDPSKIQGVDENDPASMARWMKRMGKELGEDMGEDFDSMIDGAMDENGADPEGWAQAESKEDL